MGQVSAPSLKHKKRDEGRSGVKKLRRGLDTTRLPGYSDATSSGFNAPFLLPFHWDTVRDCMVSFCYEFVWTATTKIGIGQYVLLLDCLSLSKVRRRMVRSTFTHLWVFPSVFSSVSCVISSSCEEHRWSLKASCLMVYFIGSVCCMYANYNPGPPRLRLQLERTPDHVGLGVPPG